MLVNLYDVDVQAQAAPDKGRGLEACGGGGGPQWTRYLEAYEGSPEAFLGQVLVMFAAWVADQELQSVKRRTKEGLERVREQGKVLGPPRKFTPNQVETMRRMREGGTSLRRIASEFERSASTVRRALLRERVG